MLGNQESLRSSSFITTNSCWAIQHLCRFSLDQFARPEECKASHVPIAEEVVSRAVNRNLVGMIVDAAASRVLDEEETVYHQTHIECQPGERELRLIWRGAAEKGEMFQNIAGR
jgi:hypothetical protein